MRPSGQGLKKDQTSMQMKEDKAKEGAQQTQRYTTRAKQSQQEPTIGLQGPDLDSALICNGAAYHMQATGNNST